MIISNKHKYLFVELPHTGSTAISKELCENYEGERILKKHSLFHEFKKLSINTKKYYIFSCIRNPMDEVVSIYLKYKTDQIAEYTQLANYKRASLERYFFSKNNNYQDYLKKFYKLPYDNWSCLAHKRFDRVIRFENLQRDFQTVLEEIGLEQKRPLPVVNTTNQKKHYLTYYSPEIYNYAKYVFGPFMKTWDYAFPAEWGDGSVPIFADILFDIFRLPRKTYWRYFHDSHSMYAEALKMIVGR
ncbi:MAG: sulfotransferase family 2 domain-containing protein [Anaerolineales bacterium]|nr:sulfotransferase family 2 domain-containing protein [Anaerolineales bacterium]